MIVTSALAGFLNLTFCTHNVCDFSVWVFVCVLVCFVYIWDFSCYSFSVRSQVSLGDIHYIDNFG